MAIKLLATFMLITSAYLSWWAASQAMWLWTIPAVVALSNAVGLLWRKRWAKLLWYATAVAACGWWVFEVVQVALSGWPYSTMLDSVISLVPGLLLLTVCIGGSVVVTKDFHSKTNVA